jgi:uncharacterized membrane protein (Fun14 family)
MIVYTILVWRVHNQFLKFLAVIAGLFMAALAYLEYQGVIIIDWTKLQAISGQEFTTLENTISLLSSSCHEMTSV